jgi:MobA/MobL family
MAIVHVIYKSSSQAPPAAAHAQYIARDGQYQRRGGVELVESGNMPEFAQADPHSFWVAADAHERANGRAYTEIQIALPRELEKAQREELAREITRELMGDRFAYTMAVHVPLAKDNIDQPHLHLMFSERAVDEQTRELAEDRFFKRNGARKDPAWNDRNKPEEVREKWVEMMNRAMEHAGHEQRLDARSWAEQGREDLAALREPKLLGGVGHEATELRDRVEELRRQREELPALHLDQMAAVEELEKRAEAEIARIEQQRDEQISILDKLIEKARELAKEVKERATEIARNVAERVESFFGVGERGSSAEKHPVKEQEQARPPTLETALEQIDDKLSALDRRLAAQQSIDDKLANLDKRLQEQAKAQQEKELSQKQDIEISPRNRGKGFGIER